MYGMMDNKLILRMKKWSMRTKHRLLDYFSSWRRWPGKFCGVREGSRTQFWYLPDDIIRDNILPFLKVADIVRVESLIPQKVIPAVLYESVQSGVLKLSNESAVQALVWLFYRKISPRKVLIKHNVVSSSRLQYLISIMHDTESIVVKSDSISYIDAILAMHCAGTEHLRELDLSTNAIMCDKLLKCIRQRLTGLELLHFTLGPLCTVESVTATMDALSHLRDFGMYQCVRHLIVQQGYLISVHCQNLTALTVTGLFSCFTRFLAEMAPNLRNLVSLDISHGEMLHSGDAFALVQHCGRLQRLILADSDCPAVLGFTDTLAERMHMLPELRCLDVSYMADCRDALIEAAARHCPHLQELHIHGCKLLTDASVQALIQNDNPLTFLGCVGCRLLTEPALEALKELNPAMRICRCMYELAVTNA
jgi:hypothetical protein